jgi:hypothetical protein
MFAGQRMGQRSALAHAIEFQESNPRESVKIRGLKLCSTEGYAGRLHVKGLLAHYTSG